MEKNKKNRYTPANSVGYTLHGHVSDTIRKATTDASSILKTMIRLNGCVQAEQYGFWFDRTMKEKRKPMINDNVMIKRTTIQANILNC